MANIGANYTNVSPALLYITYFISSRSDFVTGTASVSFGTLSSPSITLLSVTTLTGNFIGLNNQSNTQVIPFICGIQTTNTNFSLLLQSAAFDTTLDKLSVIFNVAQGNTQGFMVNIAYIIYDVSTTAITKIPGISFNPSLVYQSIIYSVVGISTIKAAVTASPTTSTQKSTTTSGISVNAILPPGAVVTTNTSSASTLTNTISDLSQAMNSTNNFNYITNGIVISFGDVNYSSYYNFLVSQTAPGSSTTTTSSYQLYPPMITPVPDCTDGYLAALPVSDQISSTYQIQCVVCGTTSPNFN